MCGIVGYVGQKEALKALLDGLYKLEYRGYDSAGVACQTSRGLEVCKTKGRIETLDALSKKNLTESSNCGIGHTRWATHGEPSDVNAHPHQSQNKRVALVHNGIIENYLDLRKMLVSRGYALCSQTDTETVAHLFEMNYKGDMVQAMFETLPMLRGSYALAVTCLDQPGEIVCTRLDNPLIIGVGKGENVIASDIPAILEHTKDYIILEDGEVAHVTKDKITVYNSLKEEVQKEVLTVQWDVTAAQKGGYEHFMLKEIFEQPKAVASTIKARIKDGLPNLKDEGFEAGIFKGIERVHIVACGSALYAGLVGKSAIERLARIPVTAQVASEFRYEDPIITERDMCIIISQSGETADSLAALREAKRRGARTVAVCNVVGSSAAREADQVLYTWAGPEIAVATTKAYSAQLSALYLIAVQAAMEKGHMDEKTGREYCAQILKLPEQIEEMLKTREQMQFLSAQYANRDHAFFIGRGVDFAACQEASLKLKEISYVHSEAYAGGELKHGTISLIEPGTLVVALANEPKVYDKIVSNIESVRARGAKILLVTNGEFEGKDVFDHLVKIPQTLPALSPSLSIIPMQMLAYYIGVQRGCDIDKPRNLAKSVTVE